MSDYSAAVGIDIGGTGAKGGLVAMDGRILAESYAATADDDDRQTVLAAYEAMIHRLLEQAEHLDQRVEGIGVGVPGYIDDTCSAMTYGNVRCLEYFNLRQYLKDRFRLTVRLDNDANCAALAEYYWGGGIECRRLLVVTVGSGIGVGVVIDGQLMRYTFGTAGELGSIVVNACEGKPSFLGGRGGLESVVSARAIVATARSLSPPPANLAEIVALSCNHEPAAAIIRQAGWWLGVGIASWTAIFCPDRVLIGGGVAACGQPFLDAARHSALEMAPAFYSQRLTIEFARLGNRAGCAGAASLILKHPA